MDNLINLINENNLKIDKFGINNYFNDNNYQMASSLKALMISNDIVLSFLKEENELSSGDYTLRLYALLQALFVSIDSLYQIAYSLTKSKKFININQNENLRILKYIRNDVVGHPSNRVVSDDYAYCILDENSVNKESFKYHIYNKNKKEEKDVNINQLIISFYEESNNLLNELFIIKENLGVNDKLKSLITSILDDYTNNGIYKDKLNKFIDEYLKLYPNAKKDQHRVLWRYDLIIKLERYNTRNKDEEDLINYCIGLELVKLYQLTFDTKNKISLKKKLPSTISSLYHFLNRNKELIPLIDNLNDSFNPLFYQSIQTLSIKAESKGMKGAVFYLKILKKAYKERNNDYLYSLALPIKEYRR